MEVMKTLVIGLGSTGTEICDSLYRRFRWQFGGIENVPWVKFLCIETDENKQTLLKKDFMAITIDQPSFLDYKNNPERHQERCQLPEWLDPRAMEDLKADYVHGGAGNIRSIGRLAFFHNYEQIRHQISIRLGALKKLEQRDLTELFEKLGSTEQVSFASDGALRVFVVGSLTGGTCSGCVADVGFLLGQLLQPDKDCTYAYLGLPKPTLSPADEKLAHRFKKNGWHALLELQTYCDPAAGFPAYRFPGESTPIDSGRAPYFAIFMFEPAGTSKRDLEQLNSQMAESIYLNILSPEIDPKAKQVDMPRHRFCTIGLGVIEFPAQRVIEACSKRLVSTTFDRWTSGSAKARVAAEIGINWDWLLRECTTTQAGDDVLEEVREDIRQVRKLLLDFRVDEAEDQIRRIRSDFRSGRVQETIHGNVDALPHRVRQKINDAVNRLLTDLDAGGPDNFIAALRDVSKFLAEVAKGQQDSQGADLASLLSKLRRIKKSRTLGFMVLRRRAAEPVIARIVRKLEQTFVEEELVRVLLRSVADSNVIQTCEAVVSQYIRRFENLDRSVRRLQSKLEREWERLAQEEPIVSGYSLFERARDPRNDGTVDEEFRERLAEKDPSPARKYENGLRIAMEDVLRGLEDLKQDLNDPRSSRYDKQLSENDPELPEAVSEAVLKRAAEVFEEIRQVDVLRRWHIASNPQDMAVSLIDRSMPTVRVEPARATRGGSTGHREENFLLLPEDGTYRDEFLTAVSHKTTQFKFTKSPDRHTIAAVRNHLGLPLDAVLSVVGAEGLHTAQCDDFRVWHTRKDVAWIKPEVDLSPEIEALRAQIVAGLLLGILEVRNQQIVLEVRDPIQGDVTVELPPHTQQAAYRVCRVHSDAYQRFRKRLPELLTDRIRRETPDAVYQKIIDAFRRDTVPVIQDKDKFGWLIYKYFESEPALKSVLLRQRPHDETLNRLLKQTGETLANGQEAGSNGYYCEERMCCAFIGPTDETFAELLWTCPACGRYYGLA
ncbi:MAG: hypothetical protein KatS3mg015_1554 [Fimbriimonadales bacterium]|nr:MAG: hypothetical protein KatS3mg015_1554 [Fimbriimonadales bacterium]